MAEPTVTIPARLALRAARHLNTLTSLLRNDAREKVQAMVAELVDAISDQCDMAEINTAAIAAEMEERG